MVLSKEGKTSEIHLVFSPKIKDENERPRATVETISLPINAEDISTFGFIDPAEAELPEDEAKEDEKSGKSEKNKNKKKKNRDQDDKENRAQKEKKFAGYLTLKSGKTYVF